MQMKRLVRLFVVTAVLMAGRTVSAQTDGLDIRDSRIVNSPDIRSWPATATITQLSFRDGVTRVEFTRKNGPNRWPDVTPAGWDGPLQYTLWLFVRINRTWTGSGFIQFWHERDGTGDASVPVLPAFAKNWYYAERWAPIFGHGDIQPGEQIGFMVTSGNARDSVGPYGPQERSNVVVIAATNGGTFEFPVGPVNPVPGPVEPPPPVVILPPLPSVDLVPLLSKLDQCVAGIQAVQSSVDAGRQENRTFFEAVASQWKNALKYAAPIIGALLAGRELGK